MCPYLLRENIKSKLVIGIKGNYYKSIKSTSHRSIDKKKAEIDSLYVVTGVQTLTHLLVCAMTLVILSINPKKKGYPCN